MLGATAAIDMGRGRTRLSSFGRGRLITFPVLALLVPVFPVAGFSGISAPAIIAFGAYFPDWLFLAIVAIAAAIVTRVAFGIAGRAAAVPFPLFTCLAVGILLAGFIDLLWFGR